MLERVTLHPTLDESPLANAVQMRSLREKIKEMQSSHEAQIGIVLEKFQMLRNQISEYHETLEAAMVLPEHTGAVRAVTLR